MPDEIVKAVDSFFLSYSRADERFALRFAKDVRAHGVAIWVDQLDIRPSEHWDRAVERALRESCGMVVILSPRSAASDNVADEISFAIDSGKSVLPVMIERCTPPLRITRMHMIDATAGYDRALQQCLAEIRRGNTAPEAKAREAAAPAAALNAETIVMAKQQLTSIVGPIAAILVDKAAARAASVKDLYSLLMLHLDDEADRASFAALSSSHSEASSVHAPAAKPPATELRTPADEAAIAQRDVDRVASILMTYLGPIAPIISRRESRISASLEELQQRLAALIPNERDRADFLNRLR